jgi:hypothetical protein
MYLEIPDGFSPQYFALAFDFFQCPGRGCQPAGAPALFPCQTPKFPQSNFSLGLAVSIYN